MSASRGDLLARVERTLASWRPAVADEIARWLPKGSSLGPVLYEPMERYALRPGKGLRPALCLTACSAAGGSVEAALPTAAVLELFHNAFLVHDDVEDGSFLRRNEPSLHALYGVPIAVNMGDAMLALALPPLLENTRLLGVGRALKVLDVIASMVRETTEGQAIELHWTHADVAAPDDDAYFDMVTRKTASYSFVAPLVLGATIAGVDEVGVEALQAFGEALGVAFQIRDDVLNLRHDVSRWGKDAHDDLWEGKRTLILSHAIRHATHDEQRRASEILALPRPTTDERRLAAVFDRLVRGGQLSQDGLAVLHASGAHVVGLRATRSESDIDFLMRLIERAGSLDHGDREARRFAERARAHLDTCAQWLSRTPARTLLEDLVAFVSERDH